MYQVYCDGRRIDGDTQTTCLIDPTVTLGLNKAGSCEFTLPPNHINYNLPKVMKSNVEVRKYYSEEGYDVIFFGRISNITIDWFKRKKITCEGALAFFNDSLQRYKKYNSKTTTVRSFFRDIITNHNNQMIDDDRKFQVGIQGEWGDDVVLITPSLVPHPYTPAQEVEQQQEGEGAGEGAGETEEFYADVADKKIYRLVNYESTLDVLVNMCLDAEGGNFYVTREKYYPGGGPPTPAEWGNFIYWRYKSLMSDENELNQPIQFALNLTDISQDFEIDEFYTALLPLGATDSNGKPITIKSVNDNVDYIQNDDAVNTYGFVLKTKEWSDISKPRILKEKAFEWLQTERFSKLMITCNAADLSVLDPNYGEFFIGARVRVTSSPHGLDRVFPISEIVYHLDSGKKEITVGTAERKTLSYITKKGNVEYRLPDAYYDDDPDPD